MKVANILSDTNLSVSDYFNVVDSMDYSWNPTEL
jgi:hypothetical protein